MSFICGHLLERRQPTNPKQQTQRQLIDDDVRASTTKKQHIVDRTQVYEAKANAEASNYSTVPLIFHRIGHMIRAKSRSSASRLRWHNGESELEMTNPPSPFSSTKFVTAQLFADSHAKSHIISFAIPRAKQVHTV